jgi:hypothetical protein
MDVSYAFGKLQQQILCCDNPDNDMREIGG